MSHPSSRRAALRLLGSAPLLAAALASEATSADSNTDSAWSHHSDSLRRRVPKSLLPGGSFEQFVQQLAAEDKFSGTVLLAHRGRPVLLRAFRYADPQLSLPNRLDTIFTLASVTKSFTGIAIGQLVQQDRIRLHEKLGAYLEGFPAHIADTVTVQQLLTHTSGIGPPPLGRDPLPDWNTVEEFFEGTMNIIRAATPLFTPGTQYGYSNAGFHVLGGIIAQVSGQSYFDYVREHIFAPAGMTSTDFYTRPQVLANSQIARPYWLNPRSGQREDFTRSGFFPIIGGPDSGIYSTASDMLRFVNAVLGGKLLHPSFVEMFTTGKFAVSPDTSPTAPAQSLLIGYGFEAMLLNNEHIFGHAGGGPGRATNLDVFPDLDWATVILSNYDNNINPIVQLARKLITE